MPIKDVESVMEIERVLKERKADAEAQARQMSADAEKEGLARLQQIRVEAAENGKNLLEQAEKRAAEAAETIRQAAEKESAALQAAAEKHLDTVAEFIVGRVVNH